ncbi:hypothetical protein DL240_05705 [Lujinxingia litoralis]|uniref:Haemolysin activator HlyB C-terminal domain-containing protein n=1 Tax=Lujinxingia litoralis TaxID=2211119 RepID=A0A328C9I5_9DELT|nr:hypothetical protein [Lujinxingia litoralis]RAL23654.1 hypothetical protein DL240_05705 [Lujinxingia litoralis]
MRRPNRPLLMVVLALLMVPAMNAWAQSGDVATHSSALELPRADELMRVMERVRSRTRSPLWRCAPQDETSCTCVGIESSDWKIQLLDVRHRPESVSIAEVRALGRDQAWVAQEVVFGDHDTITLHDLRWQGLDHPNILHASRAVAQGGSGELILEDVRWHRNPDAPPLLRAPHCQNDDALTSLTSLEDGRAGLRLARARYFPGAGWTLQDARLGAFLKLGGDLAVNRRTSGVLPPTLRVGSSGAQVELGVASGRYPLLARVTLDDKRRAAAGLSYLTQPATCAGERCAQQAFGLDFGVTTAGAMALGADGALSLGGERNHLALRLEQHTLWGSNDAALWEGRRLEQGALLRDWRVQRAGASLGSEALSLQISAAHADLPYIEPTGASVPPGASELRVNFGGAVSLGSALADLRLTHLELNSTEFSGRLGLARFNVHRVFGNAGRLFVRPGLHAALGWWRGAGASDAADVVHHGGGASARVMIDAGLALRAQLGALSHAFSPRLLAGRQLHVGGGAPDPTNVLDLTPVLRGAPAGNFNFAGPRIEQALDFDPGWRLEVPLSVIWFDEGAGRAWQPMYQGAVKLSGLLPRPLSVRLAAHCVVECSDPSLSARVDVTWFGPLRSRHVLERGPTHHLAGPLLGERLRSDLWAGWHPSSNNGAESTLFHTSAFFASWERWAAEMRLYGDVQLPAESGGELHLRYGWPELGWAFSLRAATWPATGRWASYLGVSLL